MLRGDLEGLVGALGFHFRGFLSFLSAFIGVLSYKCVEVADVAFPGLEEFLDLLEFGNGLLDFADVHVGQETNDVVLFFFVVRVNRDDQHVGQQQKEYVEQQDDKDKLEIIFLNLVYGGELFTFQFIENQHHLSVVIPQVFDVLLALVHQHVQVPIQKLCQRH